MNNNSTKNTQGNLARMLFISAGKHDVTFPADIDKEKYLIDFIDASKLQELSNIEDSKYNLIWSFNHLSSYYAHDIVHILRNMHRILQENGQVILIVPNLTAICQVIADGKLENKLSDDNILTPIDLLYGNRQQINQGNLFASCKTGFSSVTLANKFIKAGFGNILSDATTREYSIIAHAVKVKNFAKPFVSVKNPDVNKMIQARDHLEKEPKIW
ncbi:MAG: hypothetical protein AAF195_03495, partial [Pseudomonadota bacterium]